MADVQKILEENNVMIKDYMQKMLVKTDDPELRKLSWEYKKRGGKGLRGTLALLICQACGGKKEEALPAAASIEWDQEWLLMHDDIEDDSELRRGEKALHRMAGVPKAVNVGDYVRSLAERALLEGGNKWGSEKTMKLIELRNEIMKQVIEGQQSELAMREIPLQKTTEKFYFDLVDKKSASYTCDLPAGYGAIIAGLSDRKVLQIRKVVRKVGLPFQMVDDLLDLTAGPVDKWGKLFAGDIAEGKRTLAAIWTGQRAKGKDLRRHRQLYGKPDATIAEKKEWIAIAEKYGVFEDMRELVLKRMKGALAEVRKALPPSRHKQTVLNLLESFAVRTH